MTLHGKKKQVVVLLPIEDAEKLKLYAEQEQRSVSQTAAILIKDGLERVEMKNNSD